MSMIQGFIKQAIRDNSEAAAREIPEIIEHYIINNAQLNRVYRAARDIISQIEKCNLVDDHGHDFKRNIAFIELCQAVAQAESLL